MASALLLISVVALYPKLTDAQNIGVCCGRNANNLPSAEATVNLYKTNGIYKMRLYSPDNATLQALQGSGIALILNVPNENIRPLGSKSSAATRWVRKNVAPYSSTVKYIAIGNDVMPGDPYARFVLPAMHNVHHALKAFNLTRQIKVSTALTSALLNNTYPPSNTVFSDSAAKFFLPILSFIQANGSNLLANIYPYFSLMNNRENINLDYALFTSSTPAFTDPGNNLTYQNLFDALMDSYYTALEKVGGGNLTVVVSGTGWPSRGSDVATFANAGTYYKNLIRHVANGTPKRPGRPLETYLHAMFDEDLVKDGVPERNFGLFTPAKHNKYGIAFAQAPTLLGSLCF